MNEKLHILILEDVPEDAELIVRELRKEKLLFSSKRVATKDAFLKELKKGLPDIILLDYRLPGFDGLKALDLLKKYSPSIPVIIVTGTLSDVKAANCIKAGAWDYVLKDRLSRLPSAVISALEKKKEYEEKQKLEKELRESEEKYRTLFETLSDAAFIIDQESGQILDVNKAAMDVYRYSRKEWLTMKNTDVSAEPDKTRKATHEVPKHITVRYHKKKDGKVFPVEMAVSTFMHNGRIVVIATSRDITDRKKAEEMLRQYEHIVSSSSDMLALLDKRFNYIAVNKSYVEAFKLTPEQIIGNTVTKVFGEELFNTVIKPYADRCLGGEEVNFQDWFDFPATGRRYMDITYYPYFSKDNKVIGFVVNGRNMTERKKVEDALKKSEVLLTETGRMAKVGGWEIDAKTLEVSWTEEIYRIHEVPLDYKPPLDEAINFFHPDDQQKLETAIQKAIEHGEPYDMEIRFITAKGKHLWTHTVCKPTTVDGKTVKLTGTFQDITERKQMEQMLLQSEKMASIGTIAAGVAHEINNPVGYIYSNLRTLEKYNEKLGNFYSVINNLCEKCSKTEPDEARNFIDEFMKIKEDAKIDYILTDTKDALSESLEGTEKVKKIVLDLKDFSRVEKPEIKLADINDVIEKTLNIIRNELKYKAEVIKEFGDIPEIECDMKKLEQVFMNILVNAAQAIEKHGIITIKTFSANNFVAIQISDTGKGMPKENIGRIFDAFFTTKEPGKGTGLGLSISYRIIQEHNGTIDVESEIGKGTTFTIKLPVKKYGEIREYKILIVDDEESLREMLNEVINEYGPSILVKTAKDGFEAGDLLNTFRPDIVILDIKMPGIDGLEVCRRIRIDKKMKNTKVIMITGFPEEYLREECIDAGADEFLIKPIGIKTLYGALNKIIKG